MKVATETFVKTKTNGPAAAALLSAGIGSALVGLSTILATASPVIKNFLNWWNPAGPLAGKTGVGVIVWLVTWLVLHLVLRNKEPNMKIVLAAAAILVTIAFIALFPPVYDAFEPK